MAFAKLANSATFQNLAIFDYCVFFALCFLQRKLKIFFFKFEFQFAENLATFDTYVFKFGSL